MEQPVEDQPEAAAARAGNLRADGYCVIGNFLCPDEISRLIEICDLVRKRRETSRFPGDRYLGLVTDIIDVPELAWFIGSTRQYELLRSIGFSDPKWFMGFVIQKPPRTRGLYWHQDWWAWSDPVSLAAEPPLLVLAYYLTDVGPDNGCLRVLPGTHLRRHKLHDVADRISELTSDQEFDEHPLLEHVGGETDIPLQSGDLLIQDARVLHATHPNKSPEWRPMIFLSVVPDMSSLPAAVQARIEIKRPKVEHRWPGPAYNIVADRLARYSGGASPTPINRVPSPTSDQPIQS